MAEAEGRQELIYKSHATSQNLRPKFSEVGANFSEVQANFAEVRADFSEVGLVATKNKKANDLSCRQLLRRPDRLLRSKPKLLRSPDKLLRSLGKSFQKQETSSI